MSEGTLRVLVYLDHILLAIRRIDRYTKGMTEREFSGNEMAQDAVIRNIEIIGEAARNVARRQPGFAASHPEIPWEDVYLMRNRVAHGYFSVDLGNCLENRAARPSRARAAGSPAQTRSWRKIIA